ncbi:hotdog family protein [Permianibacter aggregans]|uniref:Putative hotdog family 3-hydroxylacyl-ACP dehydratase n=1 Tax=Permianibacter aggregans TaxID=1510150 RepID=A0A4R6ULX6_9GAMM|nr:hotdog family protein [Permianibacter aggregans]QGX40316.1 3-hydroxylacyl-ACP dehydratase [Permianibacter aggregans]TDQ44234.1 putative hotdog family 3-hydroxylacyl-ACP dehydratase [Permianibacter aggregans]
MSEKKFWPIEDLIPHRGEMILIDALIDYTDNSVDVACTPKAGGLFIDEQQQMPGWVGIELMAQAIASFAGVSARLRGEEPKVGFLLGTRAYTAHVDHFPVGQSFTIRATQLYLDEGGLGSFDCRIFIGEQILAEAAVNVFEPKDFYGYLKGVQQ